MDGRSHYGHNMMFHLIVLIGIWLLTPLDVQAGEKTSNKHDDPPGFFIVYSSNGNEKFQAECKPKSRDTVKCDFIGTRIRPPVHKPSAPSEYDKLSDKEKKDAQEEMFKMRQSKDGQKTLEQFQNKLNDPSIGPKTREMLKAW